MGKNVMVVFGTRPEAIKMAPIVHALRQLTSVRVQVVVTAQHRQMLDQVLELFELRPDADLDVMRHAQSLPDLTSRILQGMAPIIGRLEPDLMLVHGDTTTALASALAGFYARVPIGHVEAGLRSGDMMSPWPEEMNRRLISRLSSVHFAPTLKAKNNLIVEGIPAESIHVTGNTVIDALLRTVTLLSGDQRVEESVASNFPYLSSEKRLILVTGHRRENFGEGFTQICRAIASLASRDDVQVVYPVHLNPSVQEPVHRLLSGHDNVHLIEPQDYLPFVYLMRRADLILTDSGGVQEEAPSLGKPVLVLRENTERPEAVEAGTVLLVGAEETAIVDAAIKLLDDDVAYSRMAARHNPYGEGRSGETIAKLVAERST